MSLERTCPDCGSRLSADAPRGLCPECLMGAALSRRSIRDSATTGAFEPAGMGVLDTISQSIGPVPRVLLRDTAPGETPGPVVRPDGNEPDPSSRYRIDGEIARGGMGAVLKGRDPDLGRDVALKVLREDLRDNAHMVRRFVEEAQIGGQLQHPGIVPIYELGTMGDHRPFFSMKLVKGHTLSALLAEQPDSSAGWPRFLSIFESICQTVAYAHARGVIHRDLKPSNVMVGSFGEVQVMDWGLAKVVARGGAVDDATAGKLCEETVIATARSGDEAAADLSHAGSVMGTPSYMAPEQARGEIDRIDERADVFALGSILCEILTGAPVFTGRTAGEIQRNAALGDTADALARLDASGADADLITLAKDCLAREREDRPRSAGVVAQRMAGYLAGVQERMRRAELASIEERNRRRLTIVVAASLLALSTLGGLGLTDYLQQWQAGAARVALALKEATLLREQAAAHPDDPGRWPAALEGVKRAEAALADGGDPAARQQLTALGAEVRAGAEAAERDRALLARLVDIRGARADDPDGSATDVAYADAFRAAGFDVDAGEPAAAGLRIAARPEPVRRMVVAALDHWTAARKARPTQGEAWPRLVAVARAADPDPDRDALRATLAVTEKVRRLEQVRPLAARADPGAWAPASLVLLAHTLANAGDVDAAVRLLRRASSVHPTDVWVHYNLGGLLQQTKPPRREEAVEAYAAARALRPELGHDLAHTLQELGRSEEAEAILRDLVARRPGLARHLYCLGKHLKQRGHDAEALSFYERAVAVSHEEIRARPDDGAAHISCANALAAQEQYDEAIAEYRTAIRLTPDGRAAQFRASAHHSLGSLLQRQGKSDEAIAAYREVIRLEPDHASACFMLGCLLERQGKSDEAIAAYGEAIRLEPDTAQINNRLAWTLLTAADARLRDPARALELARKAAALNPNHYGIANTLVLAEYHNGHLDASIAASERSMKFFPGGSGGPYDWFVLALVYAKKGEMARARTWFDKAVLAVVKADPEVKILDLRSLWTDAAAALGLGRPDFTAEAAKRVPELLADARKTLPKDSPQLAGALAQLGKRLLQVKAHAAAEPIFRECLAIREKTEPDVWSTFNAKSLLGSALLGRKVYADAEPLLIAGYEGMKRRETTVPPPAKIRLTEALERLVQLYEATARPDEATRWRNELEAWKAAVRDSDTARKLAPEDRPVKSDRQREGLGKPFELEFTDAISGARISMNALKGKVVVIDFWATWCVPCVADVPRMKRLYEEFHDKGVEFLGISLDQSKDKGGLDALKRFVKEKEIPWPQYYEGKGMESEFSRSWDIHAIPSMFVVDQDGKLVSVTARGKLEKLLPDLLKKKSTRSSAGGE